MMPGMVVACNLGLSAALGVLALGVALEIPKMATGWLAAYRWMMGGVSSAGIYVAFVGVRMYGHGASAWEMVWGLEFPFLVLRTLVVCSVALQAIWIAQRRRKLRW